MHGMMRFDGVAYARQVLQSGCGDLVILARHPRSSPSITSLGLQGGPRRADRPAGLSRSAPLNTRSAFRVQPREPFTAVHQQVGRHQFTGAPVGNARGFFLNPPVFAGFYTPRDARDGLGRVLAEITRGDVEDGLGAFSALCL